MTSKIKYSGMRFYLKEVRDRRRLVIFLKSDFSGSTASSDFSTSKSGMFLCRADLREQSVFVARLDDDAAFAAGGTR